MGLQIRVRVSVEPFLLIRPSLLFFLGLGLRVRPNPNPLFFFLLFLFPLKAFTGLGLVNPFSVQIRKELFSFLAAPALFPRAVAVVTGVPVTSATPGPFSLCFYPVRVSGYTLATWLWYQC